jgi:uncharacterized protein YneF (UPF0154 family)
MMMWTTAVTFFMFGVFLLGLVFGILFGVFIADKIRDDLAKTTGKRKF